MEYQDQDINYDNIIETLLNTFGNALSRDCLFAIIQDCGGDLEQSANAIINMMDCNLESTNRTETTENVLTENCTNQININQQNVTSNNSDNATKPKTPNTSFTVDIPKKTQDATSYASASRKQCQQVQPHQPHTFTQRDKKNNNTSQNFWTDQLKQILSYHKDGARILIIMRGLPGSGKTYLARNLIDAIYSVPSEQHYSTHIFSTDDYFMQNKLYVFDKNKLPEYHERNERMARNSMLKGVSPVIIDNTNVEFWEMKSYVNEGIKNGYIIEVVEPNTSWARNAKQLQRNCLHNVPIYTIQRKLDTYQNGVTGAFLIRYFGYYYESNMKPPVARLVPPIVREIKSTLPVENDKNIPTTIAENTRQETVKNPNNRDDIADLTLPSSSLPSSSKMTEANITKSPDFQSTETNDAKDSLENTNFTEIKVSLEEIEKIEEEWENGEDWNDNSKIIVKENKCLNLTESRPQRSNLSKSSTKDKLLPPLSSTMSPCQDWSKISMFLPSWGESSHLPEETKVIVEKKSSSTCIELGDTEISDLKNPLKIITASPRDINEFYVKLKNTKIPDKWMLDKSTSTSNNQILSDVPRCGNEEKHFSSFRKLFKHIPRSDLRHIFDNCNGDVNWAVDIVLDGVDNQKISTRDPNDVSDTEEEEENEVLCTCLAAYEILPDRNESSSPIEPEQNTVPTTSPVNTKKGKKEIVVSEASIQLKRQIEENVVIPDNHYSQHCLKIRKIRRGECIVEENNDEENLSPSDNTENQVNDNIIPSTSGLSEENVNNAINNCTNKDDDSEASEEELTTEDELVNFGNVEETIHINVGHVFIQQLDALFGRGDMEYPPSIKPRLNIRTSLLNEINALWMESLMYQFEESSKQTDLMIKQDEEFARALLLKEEELLREGREPEIPDFKEIMDMDFALTLYYKDVDEWRNHEPGDLAARLSRDKLYNLFPELPNDLLSEVLMAHDNNFQNTVEVLLISTGRDHILDKKNGISKFVMEKEIERQEKILEKEKKELSQVEWPLLPTLEKVDMETVQMYRDQADNHLARRNLNYQKAQDYIRRGMTQVATYYSDYASYHTKKYEQANSLAAATLMQLHASNCADNATIDLHYLRVGEAKESLDLFLDTHIQKLKETQDRTGIRSHTLFFITGRGLHSNGKPRVKPAVMKRLQERGLSFYERNPGLLTAKVCADDKLSYQIA
ncbi:uncharacterized protein LOC126772299 [Nymphalis io]|uniref:uncharacterized protein LOC126772299 n=1 Tax=Inachis io TaxID=171585 RepID=UPI00216A9E49|nr:uncharacterized protein LOC126772299 [Nymphalis io]